MRPRALAPLLLAATLLPGAGAASPLNPATLAVTVTVIRRVAVDVTRSAPPTAVARVRSGRLVFIDDAPPALVVEVRGVPIPEEPSWRRATRDVDRGMGP